MPEKDYVIMAIGIVVVVLYRNRDRQSGNLRLPAWGWNLVGIFLFYMFLRNANETLKFVNSESDQWWPIIKETAHELSEQLRKLFNLFKEGGN